MFETLPASKPDAILALMAQFREDTRENKIDLGVGVYKDARGRTPIMSAVKKAERQLLDTQDTKAYVSPTGSKPFVDAMLSMVFGDGADLSRLRGAQAPGGSGALRILGELLKSVRPDATLWVSEPTWPNHIPLLSAAGFGIKPYPYYNAGTGQVDIQAMLATLGQAAEGDIVVLHGCCHNPTGADLSAAQWTQVADLLERRQLFPFVDLAYQGFGDGLEEDAAAVRMLATRVPEMAVAASCSKNLALYRERVGAALLLAGEAASADKALGKLASVIRANYSMPPDHGANATHLVLSDASLQQEWKGELESMRQRMTGLRQAFAEALRKRSNSERFDYIATQKGMFSRLPLSTAQIDTLRNDQGIYIVGDGRFNVAGLPDEGLEPLADAIVAAIQDS